MENHEKPKLFQVKTVNVNSEGFKRNFSGAQPPIMVEEEKFGFLMNLE